MQETEGDEVDYFGLQMDDEKKRVRRIAVERYFSQRPDWLGCFVEWVGKMDSISEADKKVASAFARDLIASRLATTWKNQLEAAKRKWKKQQGTITDSPQKRQKTKNTLSKQIGAVCGDGRCEGEGDAQKPSNVLLSQ